EIQTSAVSQEVKPVVQVSRLGVVVGNRFHARAHVLIDLSFQPVDFLLGNRTLNARALLCQSEGGGRKSRQYCDSQCKKRSHGNSFRFTIQHSERYLRGLSILARSARASLPRPTFWSVVANSNATRSPGSSA